MLFITLKLVTLFALPFDSFKDFTDKFEIKGCMNAQCNKLFVELYIVPQFTFWR